MIINIFEKPISKDDFGKYDDNVIFVDDKLSGYDVIVNNDIIIANSKWYDSEETEKETTALYNKAKKSIISDTYIELDDSVVCRDIPTFGVTVEDNFNILQFNLSKEEVEKSETLSIIMQHRASLLYWDMNKKFNYPDEDKAIDEDKMKKYISIYKKQGYIAPLVLYADKDFIRPYYHDYIIHLYKMLNLDIFPVRLISYKDIKYLENIDKVLYEKAKTVPENNYYHAIDNEDISKYMISNYSDKRDAVKKYLPKASSNHSESYKELNFDNLLEFLPYIFSGEKENLNKKLIDNIMNHNFSPYFYVKNGKQFYNMTLSEFLFNHIRGFINTKEISADEETIVNKSKDFESKKEIDFDPSLLALDTFDYNINDQLVDRISNKFGRNCIYDQVPNVLIDFHSLDDILNNNAKINILSVK